MTNEGQRFTNPSPETQSPAEELSLPERYERLYERVDQARDLFKSADDEQYRRHAALALQVAGDKLAEFVERYGVQALPPKSSTPTEEVPALVKRPLQPTYEELQQELHELTVRRNHARTMLEAGPTDDETMLELREAKVEADQRVVDFITKHPSVWPANPE